MEQETSKKSNIIKERQEGGFLIQTRRVNRKGMDKPIDYELKIPKTLKAGQAIWTEAQILSLAISSWKTENDDNHAGKAGDPAVKAFKEGYKKIEDPAAKERIRKAMEEAIAKELAKGK